MATRKEKAWTYRVERIPFGTTPEALIKQYFEPDDQSYLEVRSLCPDVALPEGEGGHGNGQLTATVYFKPKDSRPDGPRPQKSRIKVSREFVGFTPLFVPPAGTPIVADIIAVTGLAGNAYGSWAHDENEMWLRDSLQFTAPNARILTYGYVSKVENGCSFGILQDHACAFLVNLLLMRDEGRCESRPIIFIGHSLGCLIVKKAMIDAASRGINMARLPVRAIIFLAAPHKGLDVEALQTLVKGQPSETLVHELKKGSPTLLELNTKFSQIAGDIDILTCYEMKQTKQAVILENGKWAREGSPVIMVDRDSAILFMEKEKAVGVDADHSEIAKIEEGQGGIFPSVKAAIRNALRPTVSFAGNNQSSSLGPLPHNTCTVPPAMYSPSAGAVPYNEEVHGDRPRMASTRSPADSTASLSRTTTSAIISRNPSDYASVLDPSQDAIFDKQSLPTQPMSETYQGAVTEPGMQPGPGIDKEAQRQDPEPVPKPAKPLADADSTDMEGAMSCPITSSSSADCVICSSPIQDADRHYLYHESDNSTSMWNEGEDRIHGVSGEEDYDEEDYDEEDYDDEDYDEEDYNEGIYGEEDYDDEYSGEEDYDAEHTSHSPYNDDAPPWCCHHCAVSLENPLICPNHDVPMLPMVILAKSMSSVTRYVTFVSERVTNADNKVVVAIKKNKMDALQRALDDGNRSRLGPYNRMGESPLHLAAKLGRLSCAKRLLAMGIDSRVRDVDGNTALMMAVEYEHLGMVIALWGEIADINESDDHLDALRNAVDYQLFDIVKFMLEHDGKTEGYIFSQLLYRAAKVGNDKIVALLLRKQGVEVDATDEESEDAPLHIASIEGHEKVVQMLLAAGADVHCESSPNTTPLHLAAKAGKVEVCRILIKSGARLDEWNVHGDTPLILALDDGHGAVVECLLEAGANCNLASSSGLTALHVAASRGLVEDCGNLIKYGASLDARNAFGDTPLILAVDQGHSTVVQCLLDAGANCGLASPNGDTALHAAAAGGLVDICRILIGHNGGLVLALLDGVTPLQTAVKKNHLGIANLFLNNSSTEVDAADNKGYTSLHWAAKLGYVDICTTLLNHNASTCIRTKKEHSRRTPLLEAIVDDKPDIVRLLLERGACGADQNDDTADDWEDYPLFLAASLDRVSCLEHLVKYGSINFELIGLNAIAHAARHGRVAAVKLLLEKGATGVPPTGLKGKWKNLKITPEGEAKAEEALKILRELSNTRANGFPAMGLKDKWKNLKATPEGEADANEKEMTANDREANAHENEVKAFENELKNEMEAFKNELNAYDSEVLETPRDRLNTLATEPPATGLKSKWKNLKANPEGEAQGEANEVLGTLKELSNATQKMRVKGKAFVGLVQTLKRR